MASLRTLTQKVREAASRVVVTFTSTKKIALLRSTFLQLNKYFRSASEELAELDDNVTAPQAKPTTPEPVKQKTETTAKVNQAIQQMAKCSLYLLCKEARIEMDPHKEVQAVLLKPCIDTDPTLVGLVQNHVNIIANLATFPLNRPKTTTSEEPTVVDVADFKKKQRKVNHSVVKVLISSGALCLIDLLYAYTSKLLEPKVLNHSSPPKSKGQSPNEQSRVRVKGTPPGKNSVQGIKKTSSLLFNPRCNFKEIYEESEQGLIISLICAIKHFAECSSTTCFNSIEEEIKLKMLNHKLKATCKAKGFLNNAQAGGEDPGYPTQAWGSVTSNRPSSRGPIARPLTPQQTADVFGRVKEKPKDSLRKMQRPSTADKVWDPKNPFLSCTLHRDPLVTLEQEYNERIKREIDSMRLNTRKMLFQRGCLEAVGPWLIANEVEILEPVGDILRYMVQSLGEKHLPHPPTDKRTDRMSRTRPVSATTPKDQEVVLNKALKQMSSKVAEMVREALGPRTAFSPLSKLIEPSAKLRPSSAKAVMMTGDFKHLNQGKLRNNQFHGSQVLIFPKL
ncbi:uncharacterized protein LOC106161942 [Lingula anatina]|uniref:Uncharacterized protein LOC106161942 n=1 Tax=Lingula anatina TaxID=7574 RepID=A0A1S3I881_LINAN|nr:uncharacterized protein LOC106161942 [Lingula anatina]|eukprot:XP_013394475.1 uncharacterized protein LOC106161942 [Lingula anatina]